MSSTRALVTGAATTRTLRPVAPSADDPAATTSAGTPVTKELRALGSMVRQCLANAVRGRPQSDFASDVARLKLAGVEVGEKFLNRHFVTAVEHVGSSVIASSAGIFQRRPLPSLGIPSDVELFFDPGTIGRVFRSVRSTVVIIGITLSAPDVDGGTVSLFVDAPAESVDGRGDQKLKELLWALAQSPAARMGEGELRSRLSITTTDGAYASGEASLHNPSPLLTQLWARLRRPDVIGWDAFHRFNIAGKRALAANPFATAFFTLLQDLEAVFGHGQGRLLDRQVAAFCGTRFHVGKTPGGTREFVYLSGTPMRFLQKFPTYYRSIELRRQHAESGRTGKPVDWWVDLGRRLASGSMVAFIHVHDAILRQVVTPQVLLVQKAGSLPDTRVRGHAQMLIRMEKLRAVVSDLVEWLTLLPFYLSYLPLQEVRRYIFVIASHRWYRLLPSLVAALPELVVGVTYKGLSVNVDTPDQAAGSFFLHNACQCAFRKASQMPCGPLPPGAKEHPRRDTGDPSRIAVTVRGSPVPVPTWVARQPVARGPGDPLDYCREARRDGMAQPPGRTCRVGPRFRHGLQEVIGGLRQSFGVFDELTKSIDSYNNDVGVTRELSHRWELFAGCFDLAVCIASGAAAGVGAFEELWDMTRPELLLSERPPVEVWGVLEGWLPADAPVKQYQGFVANLQKAWRTEVSLWERTGRSSRGWLQQEEAIVAAVAA